MRDKIAIIYSSFKLFVQLYSAIIGGSIALYLQSNNQKIPSKFVYLSDALAALVAITCAIMIIDAQFSWRRFRLKLSEVASEISPPRPLFWSTVTVSAMLIVMAAAVIAYWAFNPLHSSN